VSAINGQQLRVVCQNQPTEKVREYTIETCLVPGPPNADGACAEYIVAWTAGWTHVAAAVHPSRLDFVTPPLIALRPPAQIAATIEGNGGN
jgi:hypothetical protein